jgi:2-hydroxychromene-2-carboxylate isomerase
MKKKKIDFFFFYGSVYTYLAVMRIEKLAAAAGLEVVWRPFNLREILIEQNNTGFVKNPVRMNYVWRDVERRAKHHGIPFVSKPPYPVDPELTALRTGVVAASEGWCPEYSRATYKAWFIDHKASGVGTHVTDVLDTLQKNSNAVLADAASARTSERLKQETDAARALRIFGSPTFAVGAEIFWGDDRLEAAIECALS